VTAVEQLLGADCEAAAEEHRRAQIMQREAAEEVNFVNGVRDSPLYYSLLEAAIGAYNEGA
jgi:hypothetical protein